MRMAAVLMFFMVLSCAPAQASDDPADKDPTPIENCANLPPSASIDVFSWRETEVVCKRILRVVDGLRISDIRYFEKGAWVLAHNDCGPSSKMDAIDDIVEVIRLRGLFDKSDRWHDTIDVIWKSCIGLNGAVSTSDIIAFLAASGKMSKTLSDDGLISMIVIMKNKHQRGE